MRYKRQRPAICAQERALRSCFLDELQAVDDVVLPVQVQVAQPGEFVAAWAAEAFAHIRQDMVLLLAAARAGRLEKTSFKIEFFLCFHGGD